jgi:hypothetical protein
MGFGCAERRSEDCEVQILQCFLWDEREGAKTVIFGIRLGVLSGNTHRDTHTCKRLERKIKYIAGKVSG